MFNQQANQTDYTASKSLQPVQNHGAHEMFDVQESLKSLIGVQNQFTYWKDQIKDGQLKQLVDRQHLFVIDMYNTLLDTFQTGAAPANVTYPYEMKLTHDFSYGIKQQTPLAPMEAPTAVNDAFISSTLLGTIKSCATHCTTAALETTNPVVRRVLADSVPNLIELGYELSIYQNQNHVYQVPLMPENDAQVIRQNFQPASKIGFPMN